MSSQEPIPPGAAAPGRILVVDDEESVARIIALLAEGFGHRAVTASGVDEAIALLAGSSFDVVLTDLYLERNQPLGFEVLRHVRKISPDVPVVVITGISTIDTALEAIQEGAYDYLGKPVQREILGALIGRALEKKRLTEEVRDLRKETREGKHYMVGDMVGRSPQMAEVFRNMARLIPERTSVLILGESGTGKEMVAREIHYRGERKGKRFVPVNVSAIPEGLLESELFGHVRGAFTGATATRRGLFDEAHEGTLFLDEIGDLSLALQAKLLRVLQERKVKPVGGNVEHEVDVRLICATHRDLDEMVRAGSFREDLYYRLNVLPIHLPPLRERRSPTGHEQQDSDETPPDDVLLLVEHFLKKYQEVTGRSAPRPSPEAFELLEAYSWPGNVRELENVVERAIMLSRQHGVITPDALPPRLRAKGTVSPAPGGPTALGPLSSVVERHVRQVLDHTGGNRTQAAQILGISRRTLHRMAERWKRVSSERDNQSH